MTDTNKNQELPQTVTPKPLKPVQQPQGEINGPQGPEPTRFGDWERNGRCSDF